MNNMTDQFEETASVVKPVNHLIWSYCRKLCLSEG